MNTTRLVLVGDINCKRDHFHESSLAMVADELSGAHLRFGNLEGAFHDPNSGLGYKPGWYHCEPEMLACIAGRFDAVACANNVHYGDAIEASNLRLDEAGIRHVGAGRDATEARAPAILEHGRLKVGLLSYTSVFWPVGHAATATEPGVAVIRASTAYEPHPRVLEMPGTPPVVRSHPNAVDLAAMEDDVRRLSQRADLVVVYFHWGVTGSEQVAEYQEILGRAAIDAGVDIVVGSHPHVPQGIELYRHGIIFYSLGNFIFGWKLHRPLTSEGLLARVDVGEDQRWNASFIPVKRNEQDQVVLVGPDTSDGERIAGKVAELSRRYGTRVDASAGCFDVRLDGRSDARGGGPRCVT